MAEADEKMHKRLGGSLFILTVIQFFFILYLSYPYFGSDPFQKSLSFIGPLMSSLASIVVYRRPYAGLEYWPYLKWGFFTGAAIYLVMQFALIFVHFSSIRNDGVAYWVFIELPSIMLAPLFGLIGIIIGGVADLFVRHRRKKSGSAT